MTICSQQQIHGEDRVSLMIRRELYGSKKHLYQQANLKKECSGGIDENTVEKKEDRDIV